MQCDNIPFDVSECKHILCTLFPYINATNTSSMFVSYEVKLVDISILIKSFCLYYLRKSCFYVVFKVSENTNFINYIYLLDGRLVSKREDYKSFIKKFNVIN